MVVLDKVFELFEMPEHIAHGERVPLEDEPLIGVDRVRQSSWTEKSRNERSAIVAPRPEGVCGS